MIDTHRPLRFPGPKSAKCHTNIVRPCQKLLPSRPHFRQHCWDFSEAIMLGTIILFVSLFSPIFDDAFMRRWLFEPGRFIAPISRILSLKVQSVTLIFHRFMEKRSMILFLFWPHCGIEPTYVDASAMRLVGRLLASLLATAFILRRRITILATASAFLCCQYDSCIDWCADTYRYWRELQYFLRWVRADGFLLPY